MGELGILVQADAKMFELALLVHLVLS